jgi:bifunctional non-homologous end joining protein LigD
MVHAVPVKTKSQEEQVVSVDGRRLTLKHLDKVLYPDTGTTKAALLNYYAQIAEVMLPHIRDRQVTLKRYPHGVGGQFFFEKNCPKYRPSWIPISEREADNEAGVTAYCVVRDVPSLMWLANLGTIEFHVPLATLRSVEKPKTLVFDLDPGPGTTIIECCQVGEWLRDRLKDDGLEAFPKTSGSKGLQLYVPLNNRNVTFERTKSYARSIAEALSTEHPDKVVSNMRKSLRNERVFIDWSQNDSHKTTVCVYSLRGRPEPTVSTPIKWKEVSKALREDDSDRLKFTHEDVLKRVKRDGDLFAEVLELEQKLPRA